MLRAPLCLAMLCTAACALSLLWAAPALADAPIREIDAAVAAGRLDRAQLMLNLVLQHQPSNPHAHYLQAEIFAQEGSAGAARVELSRAETLTPGLPDENPQDVAQILRFIAPPAASKASTAAELHVPLGLLLAGVALGWFLRRRVRRASLVPLPGSDSSGVDG